MRLPALQRVRVPDREVCDAVCAYQHRAEDTRYLGPGGGVHVCLDPADAASHPEVRMLAIHPLEIRERRDHLLVHLGLLIKLGHSFCFLFDVTNLPNRKKR